MEKMKLGGTGILAGRTAFGALPLQRTEKDEAIKILRRAYEGGVDFYDTARGYTDSEEKIGLALSDVRKSITIATKTSARDGEAMRVHLAESMKMLKTDYIDLYQLHNPPAVPKPGDDLYDSLAALKKSGAARFIGISCHKLENAVEAARSGLYDTVQFPLSYMSNNEDLGVIEVCRQCGVGLIAMKALCGGIVSSAAAAFAFLRQYGNVLPIWGVQRMGELEEFLAFEKNPPALGGALMKSIEKDKAELTGIYCRGCGYCLPCPAEIPIHLAARMTQLLVRSPWRNFMSSEWRGQMEKIENCTNCGHCRAHCPYGIDTPALLRANLKFHREFWEEHKGEY
jgi:aryl-alcohol dehydrogenase-like predicted oxidoreductase